MSVWLRWTTPDPLVLLWPLSWVGALRCEASAAPGQAHEGAVPAHSVRRGEVWGAPGRAVAASVLQGRGPRRSHSECRAAGPGLWVSVEAGASGRDPVRDLRGPTGLSIPEGQVPSGPLGGLVGEKEALGSQAASWGIRRVRGLGLPGLSCCSLLTPQDVLGLRTRMRAMC